MRPKFTVSRTALDLIMAFEGFRPDAMRLNDGRWMIGFGHTKTARAGVRITEADAEALLSYDLIGAARMINENLYAPITQNQFDALCSFAFNIGEPAFLTSPNAAPPERRPAAGCGRGDGALPQGRSRWRPHRGGCARASPRGREGDVPAARGRLDRGLDTGPAAATRL